MHKRSFKELRQMTATQICDSHDHHFSTRCSDLRSTTAYAVAAPWPKTLQLLDEAQRCGIQADTLMQSAKVQVWFGEEVDGSFVSFWIFFHFNSFHVF